MFQTKVVEKIKTQILNSIIFFYFENRAVYVIMRNNTVERGRPQMADNMSPARCLPDT
jgi:hypothetical protein